MSTSRMSTSVATLDPPASLSPRDAAWRAAWAVLRSGAFVSACATALALETSALAGVARQPWPFYAFVFCATWTSYRLGSIRPRPGVAWRAVALTWAIVACVAGAGATLPRTTWPAIALLVLLSWGYSLPTMPGVRRFREFGFAKALILAGVWTTTTTYLPLVDRPLPPTAFALLLARRFLFIFTLCIAFDVRDRLADAKAGIRTLPVRLGVARSYVLMRVTLLAFVALVVCGPTVSTAGTAGPIDVAMIASAIATWIAIEAARRARPNWFYLGFVDGMMLLQATLVWAMLWTTRR